MLTVIEALRAGGRYSDDVVRATNLPVVEVMNRLQVLEAEGIVVANHTGTFSTYSLSAKVDREGEA